MAALRGSAPRREQLHVATVQWGLGAYERFVDDEGEEWLHAALAAGEHLLETQHEGGPQDGGWRHFFPMPHTYLIAPPWLSGIAQGEAASLLVRLHLQTGDARFARGRAAGAGRRWRCRSPRAGCSPTWAARRSSRSTRAGPPPSSSTARSSLSGAIATSASGSAEGPALERFEALTSALASNLDRWDTGFWSRYDLYPHRVPNIASPAYHLLHIRQLEVLDALSSRPQIRAVKNRFQDYRGSADLAAGGRWRRRSASASSSPATRRSPTACRGTRRRGGAATATQPRGTFWSSATTPSAPTGTLRSRSRPEQLDAQLGYLGGAGVPKR